MNAEDRKRKQFYCGTSNVVLPVANKGFFPPEYQDKTRLTYYSSILNSVEVNSTFYKLPLPRTVEKWVAEVPEHFRFTFKVWKEITHAKELNYDVEAIHKFMQVVERAGEKKGCLLLQFPASIKGSMFHKFRHLLDDLSGTGMLQGWHLAVEFRDKSWYRDSVYQLLEHYNASVVMHDMPKSFTPLIDMEKSFVYLRFHGELGDYRGCYTDDCLREHATYIQDWLDEGLPVFAYFNNTIGDAIHNAITLDSYLHG
jgi:uncharacterized protein YecE (DUF72 family)